jgi:2'-5' RNA ligase
VSELIERTVLQIKRKPGIIDIRWSNPSEYVINLVPLGEVSPSTLSVVGPAVGRTLANCNQFELELTKLSGTPNMIQPRFAVLQLGGEGAIKLSQIAAALDLVTKPLIPARDGKAFLPNIVLGRLKTESEQMRVALGRALKFPEHPPFGIWQVHQLELLISVGTSVGTDYKAVETFKLVP